MPFAFHYAARSDVGMVRSNNEDSGYAGPHLLAMADGMGGHAGGAEAARIAARTVESCVLNSLKWFLRMGGNEGQELIEKLSEAVEEAGVELLPYGGELGSACTCEAWLDPCPHALAVLTQLAWLIQADPFVLTHLRGLSRDRVLRDLHRITQPAPGQEDAGAPAGPDEVVDLVVAEDAAVRAARLLQQEQPFDAW